MMAPLIASMTAKNPAARPDAAAALEAWRLVRTQIPLRQRLWRTKGRDESLLGSVFRDTLALVSISLTPI